MMRDPASVLGWTYRGNAVPHMVQSASRTVTHAEHPDGLDSSAILGTKTNAAKDFDRCMRVSYKKLDLKTNA